MERPSRSDVERGLSEEGAFMRYFAIVGCFAIGCLLPVTAMADVVPHVGPTPMGAPYHGSRLDCPGVPCYTQIGSWDNGGSSQDEMFYYTDPNCYLVSEMADDFPPDVCCIVTAVRSWSVTTGPPYVPCPDLGVRFFEPGPSPGAMMCDHAGPATCEEVSGYPGLPSFEHCSILAEPCNVIMGGWVGVRSLDCRYMSGLGQFFWAMSEGIAYGQEAHFKSDYFGYPDWVPGSYVFGVQYSMFFELLSEFPSATESSSWGTVKQLYR
jgi:hypothetical protein